MSTQTYAFRDSMTMLRRDTKHSLRNPMITLSAIGTPVIMMLLFVGMFGDVMAERLGAPAGGYVAYLIPGVVLMGLGSGVATTAININVDKSEGVIARFRTMPIARTAFLNGAAIGAVVRSMVSIVFVIGLGFALGFRSGAGLLGWIGALGLVTLVAVAFTWLGIAFGLFADSPATANSLSLIPQFLPLLSSGFVPTESMPGGIRWFAEHQPYTPLTETFRSLVTGTPVGGSWVEAVAWCLAIAAAGYFWARHLFEREQPAPAGPSVAQIMSH